MADPNPTDVVKNSALPSATPEPKPKSKSKSKPKSKSEPESESESESTPEPTPPMSPTPQSNKQLITMDDLLEIKRLADGEIKQAEDKEQQEQTMESVNKMDEAPQLSDSTPSPTQLMGNSAAMDALPSASGAGAGAGALAPEAAVAVAPEVAAVAPVLAAGS